MRELDDLFQALQQSAFRRRQRLAPADRRYLAERGRAAVMDHAHRFIAERLAPADPPRDGRQTPMRGHPVFTAQHATATCCRGCLAKWHDIPKGRSLNKAQRAHVLAAIHRWLANAEAEANATDTTAESKQMQLWP